MIERGMFNLSGRFIFWIKNENVRCQQEINKSYKFSFSIFKQMLKALKFDSYVNARYLAHALIREFSVNNAWATLSRRQLNFF